MNFSDMYKRLCILLPLVLLLSGNTLFAQTGLSFLKIGPSAREQALANTGVASSTDAAANYYNPALLQSSSGSSILFSQNFWLIDTYSSYAAAQFNGEKSAFGVALNWLSVRDIPVRTSPTDEPDGYFSSQNAALGLSYAHRLSPMLTLAVTGKLLYEKIFIDDALGFAADLSAAARPFGEALTIGATMQNIGSMGKLAQESSDLPTTLRLGAAYRIPLPTMQSNLLLEGGLTTIFSDNSIFSLGTEFGFQEFLWGRLGMVFGNDSRGISAGVGLKYNQFKFDYAFIPFSNELGSASVLTLQFLY
ncbi:MAG: PorV/PorQ family protein [Chlorobiales bacterium]|nr:PorV/PorQ family protein [Chlorobiales bacterium]